MKTGTQPRLRSQPPARGGSTSEAIERLDKLSDWTQQPAVDAANAISKPVETPAGQGRATTKKTAVAPAMPAANPDEPAAAPAVATTVPWGVVSTDPGTEEAVKLCNFRLPVSLYAKLKWLGDTTYGETMTSIVIDALTTKTNAMLKERNVQVPK